MTWKVLVVDDEPPTCRLIENALRREGLEVATATNGAECLLAVAEQCPDLVILDVMMPVLDGFQTLRALRENEATNHLPVLMLTARREHQDVLRGWMTGVDLYLTKPFQLDDLLVAVRRILDVTSGRTEQEQADN
jgi:DNA-binding response OmpR family regulator